MVDLHAVDPGLAQARPGEDQRNRGGIAPAGVRALNPVADLEHRRPATGHQAARAHDLALRREHREVEGLCMVPLAVREPEVVLRRVKVVVPGGPVHESTSSGMDSRTARCRPG